ncbi:MAG: S1/P1 nuclease [Limisphaerales bacterium]
MVFTHSAGAWNAVGHRIIAEMVWQKMSAAQRRDATQLLRQHPHYKQLLTSDVPRGVNKDEWAFLTAAVWPDMVRPKRSGGVESISKYDLYPHAIGYPFMRPAETNHALIENFFIARPDAEMVLSNAFATLKNSRASAHDRAVSLCWALHLCGDLHQPLHAANLVTKERPRGDELGGHHMVLDGHGKEINMHSFWDSLPGVDGSYSYLAKQAKQIASDGKLKQATAQQAEQDKTIPSWVQESFRIAVNFAYQGGNLPFVHESDLKSGKVARSQIPQLTPQYISEAHDIARQRLLLAADRLTVQLKPVW